MISRGDFARAVLQELSKLGHDPLPGYDADDFALVGPSGRVRLSPWHREHEAGTKTENEAILTAARFYRETDDPSLCERPFDKSRLLPFVRARADFEFSTLRIGIDQKIEPPALRDVFAIQPLAEHLWVVLGEDHPDQIRYLTPQDLTAAGLTFDEALNLAISNLQAIEPMFAGTARFERPQPIAWWISPQPQSPHNAVWFLFPKALAQLTVSGKPVVFAPFPDALYITGSQEHEALPVLAGMALQDLQERNEKPLSGIPLVLEENQWQPWLPASDHPAYWAVKELWCTQEEGLYKQQTALLKKKSEVDESAPFPAKYETMITGQENGQETFASRCCWTNNDTLLPKTDLVELAPLLNLDEAETAEDLRVGDSIVVSWDEFAAEMGERLRPQQIYPHRFLVRDEDFPHGDRWDRLRRRQVAVAWKIPGYKRPSVDRIASKPSASSRPLDLPHSATLRYGLIAAAAILAALPLGLKIASRVMRAHNRLEDRQQQVVRHQPLELPRLGASITPPALTPPTITPPKIRRESPPRLDDSFTDLPQPAIPELPPLGGSSASDPLATMPPLRIPEPRGPRGFAPYMGPIFDRPLGPPLPFDAQPPPLDAIPPEVPAAPAEKPPPPAELAREPAKQPLPPLEPPSVKLPRLTLAAGDIVASGNSVADQAPSFKDQAPEGGWLVGLELIKSHAWGGAIAAIVPIYQVGSEYHLGARLGGAEEIDRQRFLAKAGFAVGAIRCRAGLALNAVQVEFQPIDGKRLDPAGAYSTEWYGCPGGDELPPLGGDGHPLVGVSCQAQPDLIRLQALCALALPEAGAPLPRVAGPSTVEMPRPAHGKTFSLEAPEGGWLVGLRVFQGESWGGTPQAIQPIFQVGDAYVLGERVGREGGVVHQLLARPGYAVGDIQIHAGLVVNTLQLVFYRAAEGGLVAGDTYRSDKIGAPGGVPADVHSGGMPVVGLVGSYEHDINSLGLMRLKSLGR